MGKDKQTETKISDKPSPGMKKFLVSFKENKSNKEKKKNYTIESQDDKQAAAWAEVQLKTWKQTMKYTVTPIVS